MSGERIKAGEAYVLVTCDNNNLKNGLQEVVRSVDEAAREISAKEKELSPTVKIDPEPVKKAIDEALEKAREASNAGTNFWNRFVITAGGAAKAVGAAPLRGEIELRERLRGDPEPSGRFIVDVAYRSEISGKGRDIAKGVRDRVVETGERGGKSFDRAVDGPGRFLYLTEREFNAIGSFDGDLDVGLAGFDS